MIITHPGSGHRDDFLACCVLIANDYLKNIHHNIERRMPTEDELADKEIYVVDVGQEYNPLFRNFDHHQFERDAAPTCALSLVFDYLGLDKSIFNWFQTTEILDSKGPFVLCKELGISKDQLDLLGSPIEHYLINLIFNSDVNSIDSKSSGYKVMLGIGLQILDYHNKIQNRLKLLSQRRTWKIDDIVVFDACLEVSDPILGLELYCKKLQPEPVVTITKDDRGPGYTLFRRNDDSRIDFSKIEKHPDVIFAHKNGFVAKTNSKADLYQLIYDSIVR